ncbi:hypothetical protein DNHGIG_26000 [Collibacillus ludicampi]|uniref:Motility protein n=1 Tax=Collibacillus ludicampi TaxID=2771369 RepID=A0AAV4LH41_9BACL|nr:hypothetical protein [Collibacillus ludicampi]GIM47051.1 hypothetical protein DNHGIG_26000 [Collibacillus ludicampi]
MDVTAIQSQVQIVLQKKVMDEAASNMQNLLAVLPQPQQIQPSVSEPGKGLNLDIRI